MQTNSPEPAYSLSSGEAADYCGVDKKTIRRWSDEGSLNAFVTPGGHRRYRRSDLDALLSGDTKAAS